MRLICSLAAAATVAAYTAYAVPIAHNGTAGEVFARSALDANTPNMQLSEAGTKFRQTREEGQQTRLDRRVDFALSFHKGTSKLTHKIDNGLVSLGRFVNKVNVPKFLSHSPEDALVSHTVQYKKVKKPESSAENYLFGKKQVDLTNKKFQVLAKHNSDPQKMTIAVGGKTYHIWDKDELLKVKLK